MYTCTKPFPNFLNLSGVNGLDIRDVSFTGGGGLKRLINGQPQMEIRGPGPWV